jgi:hypothetical protein
VHIILAMDGVTIFGIAALTFMLLMYALERRDPVFILGFAGGCALSSAYGFLSGAWPFEIVEIVWCGVALRRFREVRRSRPTVL